MKKNVLLLLAIASLFVLPACRRKPKATQEEPTSEHIVFANEADKGQKVAFFDENVGSFEDAESFVLDEELSAKSGDIALAMNEGSKGEKAGVAGAETIYFDYDSDAIRADQKAKLSAVQKKAAQWVAEGKTVVVKGHSCQYPRGRSGAHKIALSNNRAHRTAQLCKVPAEKCKAFGVGEEEPAVFENSKDGQAPNRRVEIYCVA
ncbi:MAG: OmpA family protein [Candidatus Babeliales bacterium]